MHFYPKYARRRTSTTRVGDLLIGSDYPIRLQTMANTHTTDVELSIAQARRCQAAGAELFRYTTQGIREVEALAEIKAAVKDLPLVADVHFRSDVADAAALVANGVVAVAEGANMPSTPEAVKVFQDAKLLYAPGKASNAGGVSVSGLEMTQNSERLSWTAKEVDDYLKRIMNDIHENCIRYGTEPDGYINYVKGANVAGFMKVAKAMMSQGIV